MSKVLIVDDEASIRQVFAQILSLDGHEVQVCSSAEAALEILESESFEVLLSDIRMQGMNGIALLKEVRQKYPTLVTIMATAYGAVDTAVSALEFDAFDYLQKPFKPEVLRMTIKRASEYQLLLRENQDLRQSVDKKDILEPAEISSEGPGSSLKSYLREKEREYIAHVLEKFEGDKAKAAESLGVSLATFYRKFSGE